MQTKLFKLALTTLLIVTGLVACGDDEGAGGDAASFNIIDDVAEGTPETLTAVTPEDDLVVGVSFPHFNDPYWIAEAAGVQQRADELGVEVRITNANGYGNTPEQLRQIEDFITQGVDALIVGAVDATGIAQAVDSAWEQGVPVIYANAFAESATQVGTFTNDCLTGELQAEWIAAQDADAKVVMFTGPAGVSWPAIRSDCFKEKLAELAPNSEILSEKFHEMDRAVVLENMQDVMQTFPDIDYVYNNTDLQAKGVVDALRAAGYAPGDVGVTTLTLGREAFELMEDGWIQMAIPERPNLQGALALDVAVRLLQGDEVEARWAVDHPLYTSETLEDFVADESEWNWEPEGYQP